MARAGVLGVIITFVYDNLRVLRRCIHHAGWLVSLEDLVFWVWVTARIFALQLEENNGSFRLFSIMAAAVGMLVYRLTVSEGYLLFMTKIVTVTLHCIYRICYFLLYPFFLVEDCLKKQLQKHTKKMMHVACLQKIRLTSYLKMLRMTLCKRKKQEERRTTRGRKKSIRKKKTSKSV